ncbi:MAG: YaaL family protein [Eubacterium sp.]|nr:YaaL family protein [Eubacterium sp.]MCI8918548.1 YaaL family protein [Eubacterium sp.]
MFRFFKQESQPDEDYQSLLDNLTQTKNNLDLAYQNFENATDPELIDSYIYEVNAIQMRYKFLLCRLKSYEVAKP